MLCVVVGAVDVNIAVDFSTVIDFGAVAVGVGDGDGGDEF
jgi:hypothetical protein